jgi:electron transport complex protein RnfD
VAFYMATDPVSSPVSRGAGAAYGAAIGALSFVFRRWGSFPEGVAYSVLVMNVLTPFIEKSVSRARMASLRGKVGAA